MSNIKVYNDKLKSLNNTQKITKTMKMVSASKLRRAHEAQKNSKLYAKRLTALTFRISGAVDPAGHPLLAKRCPVKKALILIITSDKGLCGAFNHNANKHVASWINENRGRFEQIDVSCCGKKGYTFFKNKENVKMHYEGMAGTPQFSDAMQIGKELSQSFLRREYDEVYLVYNQFFNPLSQRSVFEKILPIDPSALLEQSNTDRHAQADSEDTLEELEYIFEPEAEKFLEFLIPHFLYFKIYFALLENSAGEHGARMSAMDNATKNASDLIDRYTLIRNRVRQAQITTELIEIVAGAEALT